MILSLSLALPLLLAGERTALGVWERWAALRDSQPPRCFAIAQPVAGDGTPDRSGAFATVAARYGASGSPAVFVRLSRARGTGAAITLAVGERRFSLVGDRRDARAPDAATDRAIVGAMRGGRAMTVTSADAAGGAITDVYALAGAPTAIDAAQLGCR
ncbi:hypothetical protein [Sphingomonas adhaesiva]|uniref:hypothetical protein n=1 Tax=Sphingomonas adhaesiva TaxID=28212 RepID=UPI002FFAEE36